MTQQTLLADATAVFGTGDRGGEPNRKLEVVRLGPQHLATLLELQTAVLHALGESPWLRANTPEVFSTCLNPAGPHVSLGAFDGDALVAAAILYDGGAGVEAIRGYFTADEKQMRASINLKLVLTHPAYRRSKLGVTLVDRLVQQAHRLGRTEILCTIHADNKPSRGLFERLGYEPIGEVKTKYGPRLVYGRKLTPVVAT